MSGYIAGPIDQLPCQAFDLIICEWKIGDASDVRKSPFPIGRQMFGEVDHLRVIATEARCICARERARHVEVEVARVPVIRKSHIQQMRA